MRASYSPAGGDEHRCSAEQPQRAGANTDRHRRHPNGHTAQSTAAERRVVEVIAGGSNTRDAASALHLSEKTVKSHLQRVYRKLDVNSRVRLAASMHGPPPI